MLYCRFIFRILKNLIICTNEHWRTSNQYIRKTKKRHRDHNYGEIFYNSTIFINPWSGHVLAEISSKKCGLSFDVQLAIQRLKSWNRCQHNVFLDQRKATWSQNWSYSSPSLTHGLSVTKFRNSERRVHPNHCHLVFSTKRAFSVKNKEI